MRASGGSGGIGNGSPRRHPLRERVKQERPKAAGARAVQQAAQVAPVELERRRVLLLQLPHAVDKEGENGRGLGADQVGALGARRRVCNARKSRQ